MTEIQPSRSDYASFLIPHGVGDQAQVPQMFPAWSRLRWILFVPFVLAGNITVAMLAWFVVDLILN
jgi:hypothetical protein